MQFKTDAFLGAKHEYRNSTPPELERKSETNPKHETRMAEALPPAAGSVWDCPASGCFGLWNAPRSAPLFFRIQ